MSSSTPPAEEILDSRGDPSSPSPSSARPTGRPSYRRTLGNRPFFLLWVAQLVSQSGDYIFEVALIWLVLELTHSAFAVGILVTGTILPTVLLGPFLGVYIDRWDRRRTLIATNVVQGLVVAALSGLVIAGKTDLTVLFAIVLMLGSGTIVVRVSTSAYVPSVVPVADLPPANSLLSFSGSMNEIVGLSLGGIFVAIFGVALPIEYDAATFFAAAILLLLIPRAKGALEKASDRVARRFRAELAEGFAFIRRNRFLLEVCAIGMIVNFFGMGITALFAPYAAYVLHGGPEVYGSLGASVAAGSFGGAAAIGRVDLRRSSGRCYLGAGIGLSAAILLLGLSNIWPISLALMAALGVGVGVNSIAVAVMVQATVPARLLGRVGAALMALRTATAPAGPIFAGWLAATWSVGGTFLLSGGVMFCVIGLGAVTMTSLRTVQY